MVFPPRANSWRPLSRLDTTPGFHHLAIMQAVESSLAELESKIQGMETTVRTHWTQPYRRSTRSTRHRQQTGSVRQTTPGTWLGDVPDWRRKHWPARASHFQGAKWHRSVFYGQQQPGEHVSAHASGGSVHSCGLFDRLCSRQRSTVRYCGASIIDRLKTSASRR